MDPFAHPPDTCAGWVPVAPSTEASVSTLPFVTSTTAAMPPMPGSRHLVDERLLGLPLERFVERAPRRCRVAPLLVAGRAADLEPLVVTLDDELAGLAREPGVVEVFETVEATAADVADDRPRDRPVSRGGSGTKSTPARWSLRTSATTLSLTQRVLEAGVAGP